MTRAGERVKEATSARPFGGRAEGFGEVSAETWRAAPQPGGLGRRSGLRPGGPCGGPADQAGKAELAAVNRSGEAAAGGRGWPIGLGPSQRSAVCGCRRPGKRESRRNFPNPLFLFWFWSGRRRCLAGKPCCYGNSGNSGNTLTNRLRQLVFSLPIPVPTGDLPSGNSGNIEAADGWAGIGALVASPCPPASQRRG
jgi:hypothetical protein